MFSVLVFVGLILLTVIARFHLIPDDPTPHIEAEYRSTDKDSQTLFVYVHGMDRGKYWPNMRAELAGHGDTVKISYPNAKFSNADPVTIAQRIAAEVQEHFAQKDYKRLILIGQSMGALLAKRTFLEAEQSNLPWAGKVTRVVLLAGMNRGWDISGQKPSDMNRITRLQLYVGSWLGRVAGFGGLTLSTETGTPFVANLRIDWINRMRADKRSIEVVQLLGDIDDLVSAEDNKDLQSIDNGLFAWIKVRGTGHGNIVDFDDRRKAGDLTLGEYRREKFILAATEHDFSKIARENEVQPFQPDLNVTHVVFVVHGIRDLGEWAASFEHELQQQFRSGQSPESQARLAVASIRYGYFGMGPFLLRPVREKYVKWFMDEYTETLARYPNATEVHFVGHSNGTYLLAAALERYSSLKVGRVVFGGSVVRKNYAWKERLAQLPDIQVRNYQAVDDWVVALFPRFFESKPIDWLLRNDLGSAGFAGFEPEQPPVRNIAGLTGGHGAFLSQIPEIAAFIINATEPAPISDAHKSMGFTGKLVAAVCNWGAGWGTWFIVWPLLAAIVIFIGWHVITAAPEPRWPFAAAYALLLLFILRNV